MKYLNLGCGHRYHPNWTNVNFTSTGENVIAHNLQLGIPFPDSSFDVVYHSHVLEHFSKLDAHKFLEECYRVLRPQGILRVVVPDLEAIAKAYLHCLEKTMSDDPEWCKNYEWILLEMYDQTVRNKPGGEMIDFLSNPELFNENFILKRCGVEAQNIIFLSQKKLSIIEVLEESKLKKLLKNFYRLFRYPDYRREVLLKLTLRTTDYQALQIGRFRQGGEIHQWMYDRFSLKCLLNKCGFIDVIQRSASDSYIPDWGSFNLDTQPDRNIYKPDSLFMEAIKPTQ